MQLNIKKNIYIIMCIHIYISMQIASNRSISEGCTEIRQKYWTQEDVYVNYLEEGGFVVIEEDVVT